MALESGKRVQRLEGWKLQVSTDCVCCVWLQIPCFSPSDDLVHECIEVVEGLINLVEAWSLTLTWNIMKL